MKTLLIAFLLCFLSTSAVSDTSTYLMGAAAKKGAAGDSETANIYFEFEADGSGGDAGKLYDEISSSWIASHSGIAFATGCTNNGAQYADTNDYVVITAAELSTANITDMLSCTIDFTFNWDGTASNAYIFKHYSSGNGDGMWLYWENGDSRWRLRVYENFAEVYNRQWADAGTDPTASTCEIYQLVIDLAAATPHATLYKGSPLVEQSGTDDSAYSTVANITQNNIYIGAQNATDTSHAHGIIDTFKITQN